MLLRYFVSLCEFLSDLAKFRRTFVELSQERCESSHETSPIFRRKFASTINEIRRSSLLILLHSSVHTLERSLILALGCKQVDLIDGLSSTTVTLSSRALQQKSNFSVYSVGSPLYIIFFLIGQSPLLCYP